MKKNKIIGQGTKPVKKHPIPEIREPNPTKIPAPQPKPQGNPKGEDERPPGTEKKNLPHDPVKRHDKVSKNKPKPQL